MGKKLKMRIINSRNLISTIFLTLFILQPSIAWNAEFEQGYGKAKWGMTVKELGKIIHLTNAIETGKSYAERMEWKPNVYISKLPDNTNVEYYFYKKKLYKIFIVFTYSNSKFSSEQEFSENILGKNINFLGKPKASFEEKKHEATIWHNIWEDNITQIDLRLGDKFIHKVLIHKDVVKEKTKALRDKNLDKRKKELPFQKGNDMQFI